MILLRTLLLSVGVWLVAMASRMWDQWGILLGVAFLGWYVLLSDVPIKDGDSPGPFPTSRR